MSKHFFRVVIFMILNEDYPKNSKCTDKLINSTSSDEASSRNSVDRWLPLIL